MKRTSWIVLSLCMISTSCLMAKIGKNKKRDQLFDTAQEVEKIKSGGTHTQKMDTPTVESGDLFLLDSIQATVYADEDTAIVTKSELERPGIDGAFRSLEDRVMEELLFSEAKKFKMIPDEEAIEKHLQAVQAEHNLTKDEMNEIFKASGFSFEEGKMQFARLSAIGSLLDFKIRSRLIVPEREIQAYFEENPVYEESAYQLQQALIPIGKKRKPDQFKKQLEQYLKTGFGSITIDWNTPFWIAEVDIAPQSDFIKTMKVNETRIVHESPDSFDVIKLVEKKDKRLVSFEERYREMADILRRPKYDQLMQEYKGTLLDNASIVYFEE